MKLASSPMWASNAAEDAHAIPPAPPSHDKIVLFAELKPRDAAVYCGIHERPEALLGERPVGMEDDGSAALVCGSDDSGEAGDGVLEILLRPDDAGAIGGGRDEDEVRTGVQEGTDVLAGQSHGEVYGRPSGGWIADHVG